MTSKTAKEQASNGKDTKEDDRGSKFGTGVAYDDAYAAGNEDTEYVTSLPTMDEELKMRGEDVHVREDMEELDEGRVSSHPSTMGKQQVSENNKRCCVSDDPLVCDKCQKFTLSMYNIMILTNQFTYSTLLLLQAEDEEAGDAEDPFANATGGSGLVNTRIADRETDYHKRRNQRVLREDGLSFKESMEHANIEKERDELIREAQKDEEEHEQQQALEMEKPRRKRRWDQGASEQGASGATPSTIVNKEQEDMSVVTDNESDSVAASKIKSRWDEDVSTTSKRRTRWDETPLASGAATPLVSSGIPGATPVVRGSSKWDETPMVASGAAGGETPSLNDTSQKRNRWEATPMGMGQQQPGGVPQTPGGTLVPQTPGGTFVTGNLAKALSLEREMESRNRPWTNAALDAILPSEGYVIMSPPASYIPLRTPGRKLLATPTPMSMTPQGFQMEIPMEQRQDATVQEIREAYGVPLTANASETGDAGSLPYIKPEDMQYFGRLMEDTDEEKLGRDDMNERRIMTLLLKIKSGTPPQRKTAMRQISDKARAFGAGPLFNQILPLLMSPTLEDQERHLLVKVIDRVLYKLDDLVRPYVHRILAVIEPLLIDEDYYARVEGREIISNLAKAAGLATMIATMRPDIDSPDEYVRNTTSRAVAVVASALGIPSLLPFLKAVCQSRKSWQARHTGIKIVQQIALLMGVAVLPYLRELVEIISHGLTDDMQKVRIITALTCAALAEASHPYGIESFDSVIRPLWKGALEHHGKALAAFLKAIGFVIPLMEESYASHYTRLVMPILLREFHSPDEEMKRIVLKVIQQCVATAGVEPDYIRTEILPEFFRNFWIRRMALDRRNYNQVIETTEELANKVGCSDVISRIVDDLKDDSEPYRRMVMETVRKVLQNLGAGDIDERLEERLIDGILYAFQEQAVDASVAGSSNIGREGQVMLDGFGTVVVALGERCKPYLKQIAGTIKWRLNNKAASVRMQAADLVGRIAVVMKACGEDQLMGHLGVVLYEYLGEEYPEVLGSILGALRAIVNVIGMTKMTPPIRDLLPRLTPILRNRHEKVQENCIDLVGRVADRGAEFVSAKEWMRICFELLEMLKAHKKAIRRAAVSTFGFIARAIGPQDVLHTLLNNLKVQDRQMRVCTTVAIAIVAETCGPFTVLPALMNEYRVPEINIQNGVLKALSFMFEYIGDMGKDYVYAVTPLLEDALMDRDPVHRQTGCAAVKHLALGVACLGCEDSLLHLLNFVWPNIFEESPHVIQAVFDAIQGLTVALGPNIVLQYALQGLYHPARKVREVYWRVYNTLYIYAADSLVAGYPIIEDEGENTYARTTLELFI
jgi:splicing factor 3B subunit 1